MLLDSWDFCFYISNESFYSHNFWRYHGYSHKWQGTIFIIAPEPQIGKTSNLVDTQKSKETLGKIFVKNLGYWELVRDNRFEEFVFLWKLLLRGSKVV